MDQVARIICMEKNLNETAGAVKNLMVALENYENIQTKLKELSDYYDSPLWRRDFEDDEKGKLPTDLKRGVLSEDAVYDLLTENQELLNKMQLLVNELVKID